MPSAVIARYREQALARGYHGDSVVNSLFDTLAAMLGFGLARRLPSRASMALVLFLELRMVLAIRDNLSLNIIQLVQPSEVLSRWQSHR